MSTPLCPVHNKPFRVGKNGSMFCATKVGDQWCKEKPPGGPSGSSGAAPVSYAPGVPPAPIRAAVGSQGASEGMLLLLGCLDFASRVYQGTGQEMDARAVAFALYQQAKGEM